MDIDRGFFSKEEWMTMPERIKKIITASVPQLQKKLIRCPLLRASSGVFEER